MTREQFATKQQRRKVINACLTTLGLRLEYDDGSWEAIDPDAGHKWLMKQLDTWKQEYADRCAQVVGLGVQAFGTLEDGISKLSMPPSATASAKERIAAVRADQAGAPISAAEAAAGLCKIVTDAMVDRFLSWRLPASVCADGCATNPNYPHPRSGTNLLTADEARQMLEHVLGEKS